MFKRLAIQTILLLGTAGAVHAAPRLELGSGSDGVGTVTIPVTLTNEQGTGIAAVGIDIGYDADVLQNPTATAGPAAVAAGKGVNVSTPSSGVVRLGIIGLNANAIGNGVVAVVTFAKKPGGKKGGVAFKYASSAADPAGEAVAMDTADGVLVVE